MSQFHNKSIRMSALLCGAAMAIPLWSAPALAQGANDAANSGDIIVTAQRLSLIHISEPTRPY